jgi:hypothetical protein
VILAVSRSIASLVHQPCHRMFNDGSGHYWNLQTLHRSFS